MSGSETTDFKSPLTDEALPRDTEVPSPEVEEYSPGEELMPLEEEEGSGSESAPGDEGDVSGQDVTDLDLQCPKEEDTMNLTGVSGCKTCRYVLVQKARRFHQAQVSGPWLRLRAESGNMSPSPRDVRWGEGHVEMCCILLYYLLMAVTRDGEEGQMLGGRKGMDFGDSKPMTMTLWTAEENSFLSLLFCSAVSLQALLPGQPCLHPQFPR